MKIGFLLVFLFLLASGCAKHDPKKEIHFYYSNGACSPFASTLEDQLTALGTSDPVNDAETAYRNGDHHLVGVQGVGLAIPGIGIESTKRLLGPMQQLGVKTVSGTSDYSSEILSHLAYEYAKTYNAEILILLTTDGKKADR